MNRHRICWLHVVACVDDFGGRIPVFYSQDVAKLNIVIGFVKQRLERHRFEKIRHDLPENFKTVAVVRKCRW